MKTSKSDYYTVLKQVVQDRLYNEYISENTALQRIYENQLELINTLIFKARSSTN